MKRQDGPFNEAEQFLYDDPLFGELRASAPTPDLHDAVLREVARHGVFTSVRLRRIISVARIGVFALGLGMLGGLLVAKRFSPNASFLPVSQQPVTRVLDEGCDRAARSMRSALAGADSWSKHSRWFSVRALGDSSGARGVAGGREERHNNWRSCTTTPSNAAAAAMWTMPARRSGGFVRVHTGVIELWCSTSNNADAPRIIRRVQALASQATAEDRTNADSIRLLLATDRRPQKK